MADGEKEGTGSVQEPSHVTSENDESGVRESYLRSPPQKQAKLQLCQTSIHKEALQLFPWMETYGTPLKNRYRIHGDLRKWLVSRIPNFSDHEISGWICGSCLEVAGQCIKGAKLEDILRSSNEELIARAVSLIENATMSVENMQTLAFALGQVALKEIKTHSLTDNSVDKGLLTKSYLDTWESNKACGVTKSFLEGCTRYRKLSMPDKNKVGCRLVKAFENLCVAVHPKYISASALAEGIVLHAATASRFASDFYSKSNASGGHTYLTNMIDSLAKSPPAFPTGDIFIAFDNQQVIGREFRVKSGGGQRTSVSTTICVFKENLPTNVQSTYDISSLLMVPSSNPSVLWQRYEKEKLLSSQIHRSFRHDWLLTRLEMTAAEYRKDKGKVDSRSVAVNFPDYENGLQYARVERKPSQCSVTDIENLMFNPNSFVNVAKVLDKLIELNGKSDPTRKWISVFCDGLPHGIAWKLIQSTYFCSQCKITGTKEQLGGHECLKKNIKRKYEKIILRPGAGHIEVNLVRLVFHEYFEVFIRPIAQKLGFLTPRSLDFCKSAVDHHKSWQILKIIFLSLTDELMYLFCTSCADEETMNIDSFGNWIGQHPNPNIRFACDFLSNVLHPIFLFRAGIRQCNDEVAYAGLLKASTLFYGFNHPKYRELLARDLFLRLSMPSVGSPFASRMAFRMHNSQYGQGLDFLLEERNKQQKKWVFSKGPPSEAQWRRASSTLTLFENIRENVLKNLEMNTGSNTAALSFEEEYASARTHFRKALSVLVTKSELSTFEEDPTEVNPKFYNASIHCSRNMDEYLRHFLEGKKRVYSVLTAKNLASLTTEEILKAARKLIRQLPTYYKEEIIEKAASCTEHDEAVELFGEVEDIIRGLDLRESFQ